MNKLVLIGISIFLLAHFSGLGQTNIPTGATGPAAVIAKKLPDTFYNAPPVVYQRQYSPKKPILDSSLVNMSALVEDVDISTQYIDSYGRVLQTVNRQSSPAKNDLVTQAYYDEFGNPSLGYLPFASQSGDNNDGKFKVNPFVQDSAFYKNLQPNEQINYGQQLYDGSPLNIPVKTTAPGNSWTGGGVGTIYSHRTNAIADSVHLWTIAISGEDDIPVTSSVYQPGTLTVLQTVDENGKATVQYVDVLGRTILTKKQLAGTPSSGHSGWLCTYYVYDEMNHIRTVLPPKAINALNNPTSNWSLTTDPTINSNLCYGYFYDSRGRASMRRIPGKGKTYVVYDVWDRPVFTQDPNLRTQNQWIAALYDGQGRPVITGILTYSGKPSDLQQLATSQTGSATTTTFITDSVRESVALSGDQTTGNWQASKTIDLSDGFAVPVDSSFDASIISGSKTLNSITMVGSPLPGGAPFNILKVLYYDDYNWISTVNAPFSGTLTSDNINGSNFDLNYNTLPDYSQPMTASSRIRGSLTGIKEAIINTGNYLYTVNIFDDHGRTIQSKQTNYTGGTDVSTFQYSFSGQVLRTHLAHEKSGANVQNHTLLTKYAYDHVGRLKNIAKNLDSQGDKTISQETYNELGQLSSKVIGASSSETQQYAYNIRGWLTAINKDYVNSTGSTSAYFGETMSYNYGFTNPQLNGTIAGIQWKAGGDGIARAYGFTYDNTNRLTVADFSQQDQGGNSWSNGKVDFTVNGLTYDAGGNIMSLRQKGLKVGSSTTVDSLTYEYFTNSNLLEKVSDGITDPSPLGDFKDSAVAGDDYTYDANGNINKDYNRHMYSSSNGSGSVFNYLDKPDSIVLAGKAGIHYYYNAGGTQLAKLVNDYTGAYPAIKNFVYIDGFVYCNDTLQYILQEEGRIRYAKKINSQTGAVYYAYEYDYFIKDHLGNVRTVLTEGRDTATYAATMETKDSATVAALFSNVYTPVNTVFPKPMAFDSDTSNHFVARLNASASVNQKTGPSLVLKVMAGDQVQISTFAYYNTAVQPPPNGVNLLPDILNLLSGGVVANSAGKLATSDLSSLNNTLSPNVSQFLNSGRSYDNTQPKAYLNWILFDNQFNYVASNSGVQQVESGTSKQALVAPLQNISKNGYLYVYVSNESQQDVYFDNLTVKHYSGPLSQEQSYYPFGGQMAGISDKALLKAVCPYKANGGTEYEEDYGLNYYNTDCRKYDPLIGRFTGVDALTDQTQEFSPFHFGANNPISYNDPKGLTFSNFELGTLNTFAGTSENWWSGGAAGGLPSGDGGGAADGSGSPDYSIGAGVFSASGAAAQDLWRSLQNAVANTSEDGTWQFSSSSDEQGNSFWSVSNQFENEDGTTRYNVDYGVIKDIYSYGIKIGTFSGSISYSYDMESNGSSSFVMTDNGSSLAYSAHTTMEPAKYSMLGSEWDENYNAGVLPHGINPTTTINNFQSYYNNNNYQSATISTFGTLFNVVGVGRMSWTPYVVYNIIFSIFTGPELSGRDNIQATLYSSKYFYSK